MSSHDLALPVERPEPTLAASPQRRLAPAALQAGTLPERIAVLVRDGVHREQVEAALDQLDRAGHDVRVLGERLGSVRCHDGTRLPVDASLRRWPAWHFDRVVHFASGSAEQARLTSQEVGFLKPGSGASAVPLQSLPWPQPARPAQVH